jgi:hypothetical protein
MTRGQAAVLGVLAALLGACAPADDAAPPPAAKTEPVAKRARRKAKRSAARSAPTPKAERSAPRGPAPAAACPEEMALVEGDHCRAVEQPCLEPLREADGGADETRCARFGPSKCVSTAPEPRRMRFCMDRYEYPNRVGELPMTLVSWTDAATICEAAGKRLCTESEFTFACEGEEMRPYAYGFERDAQKCNIDKPYLTPNTHLLPYERCLASSACAKEYARVDGREPIGSRADCVSPFGIHDLNGNANEWVSQPWKPSPRRSGIKGGWWGPVRNRCRAITLSHGESYQGYEVGFRCCQDAPSAADAGAPRVP